MKTAIIVIAYVSISVSASFPRAQEKSQSHPAPSATHHAPTKSAGIPVIISTDLDCTLQIDDAAPADLSIDKPLMTSLALGDHLITAISKDGKDKKTQVVTLDKSTQKVVLITLLAVKQAREQDEKAKKELDQARAEEAQNEVAAAKVQEEKKEKVEEQQQQDSVKRQAAEARQKELSELKSQIDDLNSQIADDEDRAQTDEKSAQEIDAECARMNLQPGIQCVGEINANIARGEASQKREEATELKAQVRDLANQLNDLSRAPLQIPSPSQPQHSSVLSQTMSADDYVNHGLADYKKGDYDRAIQDYDAALQLSPNYALALHDRGTAYMDKGDYDHAIQDFNQAIQLSPSFPAPLLNRGIVYLRKREYDRAIQDFDQAIRVNPRFAEAFSFRGDAFVAKRDNDRAFQDYDQAIHLNPTFAPAFNGRGSAYSGKGDYNRAIQDFDQAIRLNPQFVAVFNNRGRVYYNKGNYDRAIEDYSEAIRLYPQNTGAFVGRSLAYAMKGDYDRAIQDGTSVIGLQPKYAGAFLNRGFVRFYARDFAAAQQDFAAGAQMDPTDYYAPMWLFLSESRAGRNGKDELQKNAAGLRMTEWPGPVLRFYLGAFTAAEVLSAAKDADPNKDKHQHCEAYFYLGEAALLRGDREEAKHLFNESIDTGVTTFVEYAGAKVELIELTRLGQTNQNVTPKE